MILADKIINERKRCGWSQEELAEKLSVSRQSVSKWEGAQAIPDLQKILKMAELFNVTTDYLLKDEIEVEPVDNQCYSEDRDFSIRRVSIEEANDYLDTVKTNSTKIALGVLLCVASPVVLLFFMGFTTLGTISENAAAAMGITALFACIAAAIFLFIVYGTKLSKYEYLQKEDFETAYGVDGMVKEKQSKTADFNTKMIVAAVLLCVASPVPIVLASLLGASEFVVMLAVCLLLCIVALAVYIFVAVGSVMDSYKVLLKEKEYAKENKKADKIVGSFAGAYWMIITAVFLYLGFMHDAWHKSWIIWPVSGVLFAAIVIVIKAIVNRNED